TTTPNSASSASAAPPRRKPRISLAIATALGLGYIPKAPGTFGSLAGVALTLVSPILLFLSFAWMGPGVFEEYHLHVGDQWMLFIIANVYYELGLCLAVALLGVWTASRSAAYLGSKDPQVVVIDEVSGQYLALFVGSLWPGRFEAMHLLTWPRSVVYNLDFPLDWKCLLAGFILFRVFDIWKPFPARQAESLPRGWGIMADDWIAGLYAALGLWILRALGL
ncbi:MAG: phosphatidylglycerophosphatase A, partial [Candidatus Acidiferrales bacterium]